MTAVAQSSSNDRWSRACCNQRRKEETFRRSVATASLRCLLCASCVSSCQERTRDLSGMGTSTVIMPALVSSSTRLTRGIMRAVVLELLLCMVLHRAVDGSPVSSGSGHCSTPGHHTAMSVAASTVQHGALMISPLALAVLHVSRSGSSASSQCETQCIREQAEASSSRISTRAAP